MKKTRQVFYVLKTRWSLHRNHFQAAFQISDQPEVIYVTNRGVLIGASTAFHSWGVNVEATVSG